MPCDPHPLKREAAERWISRTSRSSSAPGVGKTHHWATALTKGGKKVFDKALPGDEARLRALYEKPAAHSQDSLYNGSVTFAGVIES